MTDRIIYQPANKSKGIAILLCLFLGGIGAHHFYLGHTIRGLFYLLFFWTLIPLFLSLIDLFLLIVLTEKWHNS